VLVADALDAVAAEAVQGKRGALPYLSGDGATLRMKRLEIIASGDGPGRAGRGNEGGQTVPAATRFVFPFNIIPAVSSV
jgi:hypothetical protein